MNGLFSIANLAQRIYGRWVFRNVLATCIAVAGLTIISSIMVSALLIGAFFGVFDALQFYGMEPGQAMLVTGGFFFLTTAALVLITMSSLQRLRQLPRRMLEQSPVTSQAAQAVDAFMAGFHGEKVRS